MTQHDNQSRVDLINRVHQRIATAPPHGHVEVSEDEMNAMRSVYTPEIEPKDTDIIPMTRKNIKNLAFYHNMLKGQSHQEAMEDATTFADRLLSVVGLTEDEAEINTKVTEDHVL